jgi:hypothetical protein
VLVVAALGCSLVGSLKLGERTGQMLGLGFASLQCVGLVETSVALPAGEGVG